MKQQSPVRIMVVGAGHMGTQHIKKILAIGPKIGAVVSAVVDPDEKRAKNVLSLCRQSDAKLPEIISNVGEVGRLGAESYPEAAVVAVPSSIHNETTSACLAKGLHCLVEKPLGFSALDVRDLNSQAIKSNRLLQVGLLERWSLVNLWGNWKPERGPWTLNATRVGPFVPRVADTDVVHDLMIHDVDLFVLLDSIFKFSPIKKIRAWGRKLRSTNLDLAIAALDFEDGGMARFFSSRLASDGARSWEMTGPNWHASIDFMRKNLKRFERSATNPAVFEAREHQWTEGDPLGLEIETFVQRIRGNFDTRVHSASHSTGLCSPAAFLPTPQNVLRTHEIMDEILSCMSVLETR